MLQKAQAVIADTSTRVRQSVADNPELWRSERDIWAVGIVITSVLTWLDVHPPEGVTLASTYLIIRCIQHRRRKKNSD